MTSPPSAGSQIVLSSADSATPRRARTEDIGIALGPTAFTEPAGQQLALNTRGHRGAIGGAASAVPTVGEPRQVGPITSAARRDFWSGRGPSSSPTAPDPGPSAVSSTPTNGFGEISGGGGMVKPGQAYPKKESGHGDGTKPAGGTEDGGGARLSMLDAIPLTV